MIIPCNSWILEILHFTLKNEKYSFTFKELNDPIKPTTRTKFAVIRGFWPNRGIIQILSHHSISSEHLRTSCTGSKYGVAHQRRVTKGLRRETSAGSKFSFVRGQRVCRAEWRGSWTVLLWSITVARSTLTPLTTALNNCRSHAHRKSHPEECNFS